MKIGDYYSSFVYYKVLYRPKKKKKNIIFLIFLTLLTWTNV